MSHELKNPVEVPETKFPWKARTHTLAGEAQELHMRWANHFGVFLSKREAMKFAAMDIGDLAGRMHPTASLGDLVLISDWCAWLLLRDDRWDSTEDVREWEVLAERDRRYLRMMRTQRGTAERVRDEDPDDALCFALYDLLARVRERARENSLPDLVDGSFVTVMRDFFFGSVQQAFYQRRAEYPTLKEYIKMRAVTGGLEILTRVIAATDGIRLDPAMFELPEVAALTAASHNVCCWHNDLVSFNKEMLAGEVNNLALVLLNDPDIPCDTLAGAFGKSVEMTDGEVLRFDELADAVTGITDERFTRAAEWYAEMLRDRVGGILIWMSKCARYRLASSATFARAISG